jgi:hypothetical protein
MTETITPTKSVESSNAAIIQQATELRGRYVDQDESSKADRLKLKVAEQIANDIDRHYIEKVGMSAADRAADPTFDLTVNSILKHVALQDSEVCEARAEVLNAASELDQSLTTAGEDYHANADAYRDAALEVAASEGFEYQTNRPPDPVHGPQAHQDAA